MGDGFVGKSPGDAFGTPPPVHRARRMPLDSGCLHTMELDDLCHRSRSHSINVAMLQRKGVDDDAVVAEVKAAAEEWRDDHRLDVRRLDIVAQCDAVAPHFGRRLQGYLDFEQHGYTCREDFRFCCAASAMSVRWCCCRRTSTS